MANRHFLNNYLDSRNYNLIKQGDHLKDIHVSEARQYLKKDRDAFMLNGLMTFASAINAIKKNNYSWTFIQCYYTIFYLAETLLAINDHSVYYINKSPFSIKISEGECFNKEKGNSHQVILSMYKRQFDGDSLLCGEIDGIHIIDWFNNKREEINYRLTPFSDPNPPYSLYTYKNDLRGWLQTYKEDYLYCFNSAHSYISFPLSLINKVISIYKEQNQTNCFLNDVTIGHISSNCSDARGSFNFFIEDLRGIAPH
ncbi:hypothetical protein [Bacteroides sp. AF35-22]|jgi:hypothetical protein|uniref:hypothetical protein n=1 Tax=Bacteroides sp. AF35-22 TaxID=2292932 RepID=UPI000E74748F|nr:hypothetical protein [Bacteroides sp. AF35-22]RJW86823.1 hypothetical protein DWZ80_17545 [Bacteroides sp. AF35-22]